MEIKKEKIEMKLKIQNNIIGAIEYLTPYEFIKKYGW